MTTRITILTALGGCALLAACATTTPHFDARFGDAAQVAQARQTLDAGATARNATHPVAGLDGRAARAGYDRYVSSFARPEPTANVFAIGVTGGQGGK